MCRASFLKSRWVFCAAASVAAAIGVGAVMGAQEEKDQSLRAFMRQKLGASSHILEGLTTEDSTLIKDGTAALLEMSKAEKWNVLLDEDYREFNREFRTAVRKLGDAADKENFDNATLQWMDAMKACVECHKYVRSQRPSTKK